MNSPIPFPFAKPVSLDQQWFKVTAKIAREYSSFVVFECVEYSQTGERRANTEVSRTSDIDVSAVHIVDRFYTVYGVDVSGKSFALWDGCLSEVVTIAYHLLAHRSIISFVNFKGEYLNFKGAV